MSVTSRILLMLVILAVGIAVVFALTLQGLRRTNQALQQLSSVEMEQLIASTRVMQQSEMIGSYARLVAITNDIGERRLNMVELTDRMGWLDKLLGEMTQSRQEGAIDPLMQSKRNALNANVQKLSQAIFQPAQHGLDDRAVFQLVAENQMLATDMSLLASRAAADLRRQLNERSVQLSRDVAAQQSNLNWLVAVLILCVAMAGIYMHASVSRRLVALRREVSNDEFGGIYAVPQQWGDEIDQLGRAIASYKKHLGDHARSAQNAVRAKNRFLAGASHDLRQPVQALNLFLETLRGSGLNTQQAVVLEHARAALAASREMLDTLMDYSRIEAGVLDPKLQPVAIAGFLRRLEKEFGPQADAKNLVFR
ncbi:MAG: histidine kinase dimerization/phospho-acceptor domain-containing protein, partial [Comamonas sp.]